MAAASDRGLFEAVVETAHVVVGHDLATAFGHVSVRLPSDRLLITPPVSLAEATAEQLVELGIDDDPASRGAPPEALLHQEIYRRRPDVTAVVRAQPPSGFALAAVLDVLVPLHGQGAWLGPSVPVHPGAYLVRTRRRAEEAADSLAGGRAVLLRGNGAATIGDSGDPVTSLHLAATRMWLLEASCRIHVAARGLGVPQPLNQDEVDEWLAAEPPLIARLWEHLRDGRLARTRSHPS